MTTNIELLHMLRDRSVAAVNVYDVAGTKSQTKSYWVKFIHKQDYDPSDPRSCAVPLGTSHAHGVTTYSDVIELDYLGSHLEDEYVELWLSLVPCYDSGGAIDSADEDICEYKLKLRDLILLALYEPIDPPVPVDSDSYDDELPF